MSSMLVNTPSLYPAAFFHFYYTKNFKNYKQKGKIYLLSYIVMYKAAGVFGGWFYLSIVSIIFTFSAAVMASIFLARASRISGVSSTLSRTSRPRE